MQNISTFQEYQELFKDDLVVAVRNLLERLDDKGDFELEDSDEHNALIEYFNKFALHKKITKKQFETWK